MTHVLELQARLEALREIRASGVREAAFGNDRVVYRTDAELAAAIADLERRIAAATAMRPVRTVLVSTSKGF